MIGRNWLTALGIMAAICALVLFGTRCDFQQMKWKSQIPNSPSTPALPIPVPNPEGQEPISDAIDDGSIDSRANDPNILDNDPDLKIGDTGVETKLGVQPMATMHKLFPDKAITGLYPVNDVIAFGSQYFGRRYEYGSNRSTDSSFDCSDFTHWIWLKAAGMDIPKDSRTQWKYVSQFGARKFTDIRQAQRGDLLFFMSYKGTKADSYNGIDKSQQAITHVGIYLGNGKMMHTASQATGGVRIDYIFGKHYEWRFLSGGSVL